jgi:luciferase family oxidoreductase group 1
MASFTLSVLDQSKTRNFESAGEAFKETIEIAAYCESLGYKRFWVSEHHAFPMIAGSAPEVLLAAIGAATKSIRLGSGGIMLPHYSPYKIAEQFSVLANLYPGRIDLGVGRAPGADMSTAQALSRDGQVRFHEFPDQVAELSHYLWDEKARPLVSPKPPANLALWMLGSSADSALLAARHGLPYNLGAFINPDARPDFIRLYRDNFQPSKLFPEPKVILTVSIFCADQEAIALAQQHTFDVNFFRFITGQDQQKFLTPAEAMEYPDSPSFQSFKARQNQARATGTPGTVKQGVLNLAERFDADEVMVISSAYYFEERKESFRLVMDVLQP